MFPGPRVTLRSDSQVVYVSVKYELSGYIEEQQIESAVAQISKKAIIQVAIIK